MRRGELPARTLRAEVAELARYVRGSQSGGAKQGRQQREGETQRSRNRFGHNRGPSFVFSDLTKFLPKFVSHTLSPRLDLDIDANSSSQVAAI